MNELNIYDDSRNRGLEVLLYQPEKDPEITQEEQPKFKFKIPLFFNRELHFQFDFFIKNIPKFSGKK